MPTDPPVELEPLIVAFREAAERLANAASLPPNLPETVHALVFVQLAQRVRDAYDDRVEP